MRIKINIEKLVRGSHKLSDGDFERERTVHPFTQRNIDADLPTNVQLLFDNGHYAHATLEALVYFDNVVGQYDTNPSGRDRMMKAFNLVNPSIQLTPLVTTSDRNVQEGYMFMTAGAMVAIRNPRAHAHAFSETQEECLDHLSVVSMFLRRIRKSGYKTTI